MNYTILMSSKNLMTSVAALTLLGLAGCASPSTMANSEQAKDCSKAKSADNDASCTGGAALGPPVVDISKPAPAPGVASPASATP